MNQVYAILLKIKHQSNQNLKRDNKIRCGMIADKTLFTIVHMVSFLTDFLLSLYCICTLYLYT